MPARSLLFLSADPADLDAERVEPAVVAVMAVGSTRPASTVVLLRQTPSLEVFLVRRHDNIAFMGGAHVFPGGRVDESDHAGDAERFCDGIDAATARMHDLSPDVAVAHHVAAIRELFEEAGVLLARRDGAVIAIDADNSARFLMYRQQLAAGGISLNEIVSREGLRLALDELAYFAHWVTPEIETRRFDTRFFAAAAPVNQEAAHDQGETTHGEWLRPADAIARCLRGEIALPPPTWTTLRELERFAGMEEAMAWARTRDVPRVQPGFIQDGTRRMVLLPGDDQCPRVTGFSARETRFILENGRWHPVNVRQSR
jgi:8-oxo-dGTP pyrophosphatase MutT (NUDIX family)